MTISILAVLADRDFSFDITGGVDFIFQSSRSLRTATSLAPRSTESLKLFQSSRSLRTATGGTVAVIAFPVISILAVLADRDVMRTMPFWLTVAFQSSRSLRTATWIWWPGNSSMINFNPRGPCGPRLVLLASNNTAPSISILAVLADRDRPQRRLRFNHVYFNPRGPCGPRRGSSHSCAWQHNFNPRGPCGPRQTARWWKRSSLNFNPRGPCGPRPGAPGHPGQI